MCDTCRHADMCLGGPIEEANLAYWLGRLDGGGFCDKAMGLIQKRIDELAAGLMARRMEDGEWVSNAILNVRLGSKES
jgi:hypothetical protein